MSGEVFSVLILYLFFSLYCSMIGIFISTLFSISLLVPISDILNLSIYFPIVISGEVFSVFILYLFFSLYCSMIGIFISTLFSVSFLVPISDRLNLFLSIYFPIVISGEVFSFFKLNLFFSLYFSKYGVFISVLFSTSLLVPISDILNLLLSVYFSILLFGEFFSVLFPISDISNLLNCNAFGLLISIVFFISYKLFDSFNEFIIKLLSSFISVLIALPYSNMGLFLRAILVN